MKSSEHWMKCALPVMTLTCCTTLYASDKAKEKPNVIILFSDQHNADVFGYTGHPDVVTPNLDRMAANGMVFHRAYCQNAVSVPSRTSFFTGLYPRTLGYMDNAQVKTSVLEHAVSIQQVFRQNGYDTYAFGKRHLYGKADEGWSVCKSHLADESPEDNYVKWIEQQGFAEAFGKDWAAETGEFPKGNSLGGTKYPAADMGTRTSGLPPNMTMEAYSALNTLEVIKKHAGNKKPFFCFTSFFKPHQPYTPLPEYLTGYDKNAWGQGRNHNSSIAMPATLRQPAEQLPPFLADLRQRQTGIWCLGKAAENEQLYRDYIAAYYAQVEEIDHWVGEIFNELEKQNLLDNTIIIYASDHGDFVGYHGMIEKAAAGHNVYEETLRVPLLFFWKNRILSNVVNTDLVELIDVYPTLLELADIQAPAREIALQGKSLAPTLLHNKPVERKYLVSENWSQASVITKTHKLAIWLDPWPMPQWRDWRRWGNMLFDYAADPHEVNNLYGKDAYNDIVFQLRACFDEFETKTSDVGKKERIEQLLETEKK